MKILRGKSRVSTVALVLVLTITALMAGMSYVKAAERPTYAFISVAPNPVGVGQTVSVMFWLDSAPPTAAGPYGDRYHNFTVTITKPDETTELWGPYTSDPIGGAFFMYAPASTGTYKFQFSYPGETIGANYYKPSTSSIAELTVQEEKIEAWPDFPLPTDYWTRPINAENREWYRIAGNWLMPAYSMVHFAPFKQGGAFNPYTEAPDSSHIAWTKELAFGGIAGGEVGYGKSYYGGVAYEPKLTPPVIINGRLYYNRYPHGGFVNVELPGVICLDLRTGEEIWRNDTMSQILFGQVFEYDSPNQHGAFAYLWSTIGDEWKMYDAFTGKLLVTFKDAQVIMYGAGPYGLMAGTIISAPQVTFGPNGEVLFYILDGNNNWLAMWNSTKAIPPPYGGGGTFAWMWRPGLYPEVDWKDGIQWNRTVPDVPGVQTIGLISDDEVIVAEAVVPGEPFPTFVHVGYDGLTGDELWVQNRTNMGASVGSAEGRPGLLWYIHTIPREGAYAVFQKETMQWHAFNLTTGDKLWSTEPLSTFTETDWSMYDWDGAIAYGKLYSVGYSGCVTAFDLKTGQHLWTSSTGSSGYETPYGTWPTYGGIAIADGKLFLANNEHSPGTPLWRGYKLYCLDATTGNPIWNISGFFDGSSLAIADGYLIGHNQYDNRIYAFGKGQTTVEVSASPTIIADGSSVLIQGTVMDDSLGAPSTPCVSKESSSAWMEYLHMQKECPMDVTGVPVRLEAFGADGSYIDIGTVTSDTMGFRYEWTPQDEGLYTILATFNGDESYWMSWGATGLSVGPAPEEPIQPAVQEDIDQAVDSLTPILYGTIAAVAVAIGIGIVNLWALRKRT